MTPVTNSKVSYAIGTAVWITVYNHICWPGIQVDENTIQDDFKEFKTGCFAVIKFIKEEE